MKQTALILFSFLLIFGSCSKEENKTSEPADLKLGKLVQISLSVTNLQESQAFYEKLGFNEIDGRTEGENPWKLMSDGIIGLMLSRNVFPSPALTYFAADMESRVTRFQRAGIDFNDISYKDNKFNTAVLTAPGGFGITLINFDAEFLPHPPGESIAAIGEFGELSIPASDLEKSLAFWQKLGFKVKQRESQPYPRAILSDGLITIGLHQTDEFKTAALTYFSPDAQKIIQNLETEDLPVENAVPAESKDEQNAILKSPDGQLIFIFQGTP